MRKAIGLDFQNCLQTGDKTMTLTGGRIDGHSVPCVLILNSSGGVSQALSMEAITKDKDYVRE